MRKNWVSRLLVGVALAAPAAIWAGGDLPTKFSNIGSIVNTRHNMTQRDMTIPGANGPLNATIMDNVRNDYGEVCVYCHTPHGANNSKGSAPLWNRTLKNNTYQTYNDLGTATLTQTVTPPGANSLTCLSCHDGTTAIDSIINMPSTMQNGANPGIVPNTQNEYEGYSPNADRGSVQNNTFLSTWRNSGATVGITYHQTLNYVDPNTATIAQWNNSCLSCHSTAGLSAAATDFTIFAIGLDLRNDHPVGITFPLPTAPVAVDFNMPNGVIAGKAKFFDENNNGIMDKGEIRVYDTGQGAEVECASCHDPHGVAPAANAPFYRTFLRKNQGGPQGSVVCLTCHNK